MLAFYKRYWRTAFDIALIALTVWLIMYIFSFLYKIAAPVFFSLLIFACIEPLAKRLHRIGIKKAIASAISILFFTLVILGVFIGAGVLITYEIMEFVDRLPSYQSIFTQEATYWIAWLQSRIELLPDSVVQQSQSVIDSITGWGQRVVTQVLLGLVNVLSSFSTFMFNFGIGIILAYFLSIEIDMWKKIAREKTPNTFKKAFYFLKDNVLAGIVGYLKAQLILVSITFVIILSALLLLGVNNAFMIAALSAVADILPLLGVTTVFAPWIIYLFIVGQTKLAIWLTVILGVVLLARQILEPKITGGTLGVSAYTMLVCMLVSLSLFGVAGVILSPVIVILIKQLHAQGYLRRWIRPPLDYDDPPGGPQGDGGSSAGPNPAV
ncbi:MAG: AI-2E family transporter [Thermobacillus sp. ZCTH02-B1]|uniref:AI-2E family transporter n=1 Tax=Thermobacillus sp. ZCTH02-B1 TaxID=1858795 RepID=UPI000B54DCFE|nr:AI-2E family transporter [Thermobacillus sp. ZCTH02-B1]OUM96038.1 MAG: AI-2E family transporter [Thermobacillus sp. ZCTH02-B1]